LGALNHHLSPGTVLGRYEILAPIATGGMARVWAARLRGSRGFGKTVAVKTLLPTVSDDERFERMFLDEARIASRIRHSNVVSILDLGEDEERDLLYLVMEYVDGESLNTLRRAAASADGIPLRLGLKIIADTAAGLHAAHQLRADDGTLVGLVHRDVSPQNVLISYEGSVKVTDFGVAKAAGRVSQTTGRTLKGKPAFMAPEQIEGASLDARADVFALGIVLYQLVCGLHPFRGENDLATVKNILSRRPVQPPSVVNPAVDPKLEAVMLRALERDPNLRFQSSAELEYALDDLMRTGRRPRDDELAGLMQRLLGETGQKRRHTIERAAAAADRRPSVPGERTSQIPSDPNRDSQLPPRPSTAPSGVGTALAYTGSRASITPTRSNGSGALLVVIAAAAIALVIAGSAGAWLYVRSTGSEASRAVATAAPLPTAAPSVDPETEPDTPEIVVAPASAPPASQSSPRPVGTSGGAGPKAPAAPSAPAASSSAPPRPKPPVPVMDPGF
jgi:eukaryotic-like serine/threonine-protein kinase